ncbi:MAG: site-specific integrase [Pseudobdellovibrionaceae bacterium]|jgi:integrase|nr:site-specific integrase [Pseudobdellovibrionaceae bacterium]
MAKDKKPNLYNPANERAKYKYRQHLRRIGQRDEKTVLAALRHIRDFEIFMDFAGFEKFNDHIADKYVQGMVNAHLSLSYITDNIRALKDFLNWLERQRGYRSKIDYNHIAYLNISRNQRNTAKATEYQKAYKFDQIIQAIRQMPNETDAERRDKALVSLQALCSLRISELRTVKMKSLIEEDGKYFIYVCPKSMSVKFAKTRHAVFIPLPEDIVSNVIEWRDYLRSLGFKDADPLFPKVDNHFGRTNLLEQTIRKEGIKSDTTIRDIFRKAFEAAGFEYIKPHSFRKTLARYAETQSPAFLNAVRQNLGHESIDTTLSSYGQLSVAEQRKIISGVQVVVAQPE